MGRKRTKREREKKGGEEMKVVVKKSGWNDSKLSRQCVLYDRRYSYMSEQCDYNRDNREKKKCKERKVGRWKEGDEKE